MKKNMKAAQITAAAGNMKGTAAAKGEFMSKAAEEDITNQLFAAEFDQSAATLKTEKNYIDFAR